MKTVIDGMLINYRYDNNSKDISIVILPGWKDSIDSWFHVADSLKESANVLLIDLPGLGSSSIPNYVFGTYDYAKFVEKFLNTLKLRKLVLIGNSFGGRVASVLATTNKNIYKLILVDSAGIEKQPVLYNLLIRILSPLKFFIPGKYLFWIKRLFGSADYKKAGEMRQIFLKVIKEDLTSELSKIEVPTYIVWGSKDKVLDVSYAKKFKYLIKNSQVKIIWGAGHHPQSEKPQEFINVLKEVLC